MNGGHEIWRQRLWVWLPALVFFLVNAGAFSVYRLGYAGDVASLEEDLDAQEREMDTLKARRGELEGLIGRARGNRERVARLYAEKLSTRRERLTRIHAEVKELARRAGLDPRELHYPEEEIEDYGLIKRSFIFPVAGTYAELRRFINFLELSDSFLTLEEITLTEQGGEDGGELQISLTLSTLFSREPGEEEPQERPAGGTS